MAYNKETWAAGDAATYTWANKIENSLEEATTAPTRRIVETLSSSLSANTNHTVSGANFVSNKTIVIRDGIMQYEGTDYSIVSATQIKFTYNIPSGSVIEYRFPHTYN